MYQTVYKWWGNNFHLSKMLDMKDVHKFCYGYCEKNSQVQVFDRESSWNKFNPQVPTGGATHGLPKGQQSS
jgi:hypothetical protein